MRPEYVLWATKIGADSWQEELITSVVATPQGISKLDQAMIWAIDQGFDRLRIVRMILPN